jgi:hypothetical protein
MVQVEERRKEVNGEGNKRGKERVKEEIRQRRRLVLEIQIKFLVLYEKRDHLGVRVHPHSWLSNEVIDHADFLIFNEHENCEYIHI